MARFGRMRHKPAGDWVQTTFAESVVGVQYRKAAAVAFARAVREAESKRLSYGVRLEHQPTNKHDSNAIAVYGIAERKVLFWRRHSQWHIGYLARPLAQEIVGDLVSKGIPIAAELYSIYEGEEGYLDFKLIVLAPPGRGTKARQKDH